MPIKTKVAKYKKLSDMRSAWSEKFNGKLIEINNVTYKVYQVWIKGMTYKGIFSIDFKTDRGWVNIWDGRGKRPAINQIRILLTQHVKENDCES